jgi:isoaspartyl peptidase/L-asparaginase-like protein (Ntn-hydrolase superfamily)
VKSEAALERLAKLTQSKPVETSGPAFHDTVGAIALDRFNNLAVATSTGGISGQLNGRIGDSPIVGAGGYAGNETAIFSSSPLRNKKSAEFCGFRFALNYYPFASLTVLKCWA